MAKAVTSQHVTMGVQVQPQASLYGICGVKHGNMTGLSTNTSVFPCQYQSTTVKILIPSQTLQNFRNLQHHNDCVIV